MLVRLIIVLKFKYNVYSKRTLRKILGPSDVFSILNQPQDMALPNPTSASDTWLYSNITNIATHKPYN